MSEKIFHLKPWSPETKIIAKQITDSIHQLSPELEVLFMGAAALELPGKNDVDLDILCDGKDIPKYIEKLKPILGEPKESNSQIAAWNYYLNDFEIDLILSDPKTSHVSTQKRVFDILKNNPRLKEEYKKLKIECHGIPYQEYEMLKVTFFSKLLNY